MSQAAIRTALRANPEGLTTSQIARKTRLFPCDIGKSCAAMPDVYIKEWIKKTQGAIRDSAVFVAVQVPQNAPRPI